MQAFLAANVFGRDEDDSVIELRQQDVTEVVEMLSGHLDARLPFNMRGWWGEVVLDIRRAPI